MSYLDTHDLSAIRAERDRLRLKVAEQTRMIEDYKLAAEGQAEKFDVFTRVFSNEIEHYWRENQHLHQKVERLQREIQLQQSLRGKEILERIENEDRCPECRGDGIVTVGVRTFRCQLCNSEQKLDH